MKSATLTESQIAKLTELVTAKIETIIERTGKSNLNILAELFELRSAVQRLRSIPNATSKPPHRRKATVSPTLTSVTAADVIPDDSLGPPKGLVLAALVANADHLLTAKQIAEITGFERRSVSVYLSELARSGKAVRVSYGKYAPATPPSRPKTTEDAM
jgi:hypothetical protein